MRFAIISEMTSEKEIMLSMDQTPRVGLHKPAFPEISSGIFLSSGVNVSGWMRISGILPGLKLAPRSSKMKLHIKQGIKPSSYKKATNFKACGSRECRQDSAKIGRYLIIKFDYFGGCAR